MDIDLPFYFLDASSSMSIIVTLSLVIIVGPLFALLRPVILITSAFRISLLCCRLLPYRSFNLLLPLRKITLLIIILVSPTIILSVTGKPVIILLSIVIDIPVGLPVVIRRYLPCTIIISNISVAWKI
jgi:hypothetical protein